MCLRVTVLILICVGTLAASTKLSAATAMPSGSSSWESVEPSSERLRLERDKLEFERFNEKRKARYEIIKAVITAFSLLIPLVFGIYTVRSQIRSSEELKRLEARNAFELKAAEIVLGAPNPYTAKNKALALQVLFPGRLPPNFVESFEPKKYTCAGPSAELKMELLRLLINNLGKESEILTLWRRIFPDDALEQLFPGDSPPSATTDPKVHT